MGCKSGSLHSVQVTEHFGKAFLIAFSGRTGFGALHSFCIWERRYTLSNYCHCCVILET